MERDDIQEFLDKKVERREFLKIGIVAGISVPSVLAALGAAGCAKGTGTSTSVSAGSSQAPSPKTLVYGVGALAEGLDREFFISQPALEAIGNTFDPLTMWKRQPVANGSFSPVFDTATWDLNLLDDLSVSSDGKTWTFRFKKGILSHSGNELVADDFAYLLERHDVEWVLGSFYNFVARIAHKQTPLPWKVVDKYTITVTTETPSPSFLRLLENNWAMGPFDSVEAKKHETGDPWAVKWMKTNGDKAGHGPYTISDYTPGEQIVYKAFPDYHRGKPAIDTVIARQITSSATRLSLLTTGDIHITRDLLPTEYETLSKTPGVAVDNFNKSRSQEEFLMFRNDKPPFNNPLVRRALAYAAPYAHIVKDVYRGYASEWKGIISRDYPYFSDAAWPYGSGSDFAKGKALLAEAGLSGGFSSTMLYNASEPEIEQVAILLQTAFDEIGAHFELQKLQAAGFTERYTKKDFDTLLVKELALTPDVGYACYLWYRSDAMVNVMNYKSPQADALIDKILSHLDENVRRTSAEELQALVVNDSPALFLAQPHFVIARRQEVQGVTGYTSRCLRFDDLTMS